MTVKDFLPELAITVKCGALKNRSLKQQHYCM
jgi:hypothetical protein